ncbi:MAG: LysM peptidoglycan-binding domain-containing protein [Flavobacteriales bacterium]|nr:LysM peptidoglycan-binding domain-containing protein [Flavobacteriales bacterium]MCB9362983.1 LysM peptidoglycan-binding domain-containing protein [Flavobacteriales bacterium]
MIIKKLIPYIILVGLFVFSIKTNAQVDTTTVHQINGKDYYIHTIEQGNTLYFLSKTYNTPVDVIQKENPSVNDGLSIGEKIFIPLKREPETTVLNSGNYILHTVEKGRTLYALAKEYNIQQNDIIIMNPEIVDEGIKEGQIIKIPVLKIKEEQKPEKEIEETSQYITHSVSAGETLYSLSKQYNVSIEDIKKVNDGLLNGLKEGEKIYLPILIEQKRATTSTIFNNTLSPTNVMDSLKMTLVSTDSLKKKSVYKIGLLLPFYIEENEEIVTNALQQKEIYPKSKFAVEFYHGVVLALDSLANHDVKFELLVYDTKGQDSLATKRALKKLDLEKVDLIIGPLYYSNFEVAAQFALEHKIPIVSPVKQNNKILLGNQYVFKAVPSKTSIVNHIAKLTVDSFSTDNLLAIAHVNSKEKSLVDAYINTYNQFMMNKKDTLIYSSVKKIELINPQDIIPKLNKNRNNVIFVPSTNSTFVTNLFSALSNVLTTKDYKNCTITLIGLEEWQQFDNIDLEYFQTLNVFMAVNQFVVYEKESTKQMIQSYYDLTSTYPSFSSFLGFDVAHYFGNKLKQSGSVFLTEEEKIKLTSLQFNFIKTGIESGYENTNTNVLGFEDYTLKKVN